MSRETRIGILSIIIIAASIWGYKFIKGKNLLSSSQFFYIEYDNIERIQPSTPVLNRGFQIGMVTNIYQKPDDFSKITVEIEVNKNFKVPKGTIAEIRQTPMGDKFLVLVFEGMCSGNDCAKSGSKLEGINKSVLASMIQPGEISPYMTEMKKGFEDVPKALDSMMNDPNNVVGKTMSDLQATIANLRTMSNLVNKELRRNGKVNDILENVNTLTASIEPNKMKSIVGNADDITAKIKAVDMNGIAENTNKTMTEAQNAIAELTQTMKKAEGAINEFNTLLAKINNGEGSLGKLANDEKLYDELKKAAESANILMFDIQQRPQRYIPFKSARKVKKVDRKTPLVMPKN